MLLEFADLPALQQQADARVKSGPTAKVSAKDRAKLRDLTAGAHRPNTSRNAASKSCKARAPSPLKPEPCMMARVWGFSSASFLRFSEVSGV